jgi:hypothetical protein
LDLERVTVLIAGVKRNERLNEPGVALTFVKPIDLEKILDAYNAMTPEEAAQFIRPRGGPMRKEYDGPRPSPAYPKSPPKAGPSKRPIMEKDGPTTPPIPDEALPGKKSSSPKPSVPDPKDGDVPQVKAVKKASGAPGAGPKRKRDLNAKYYALPRFGFLIPINERTIVLLPTPPEWGDESLKMLLVSLAPRGGEGPLSSSLQAAAGKHAVVAGVCFRSLKEAIGPADFLSYLPTDSLLSSKSATLTLDLDAELKLTLRVDSRDAATAKRVLDVLKALHVLGVEMLPKLNQEAANFGGVFTEVVGLLEPMFRSAQFEQNGSAALVTFKSNDDLTKWTDSFAKTIAKVRAAAAEARAANTMKQLVLAVHNYASASPTSVDMPQNIVDKNGKPLLSWRVQLLPFVEQGHLYRQFHLDEPWDSEHNKKLISQMPKLFAPGAVASLPDGHTHLRMFNSPGTIGRAKSLSDVFDGTSNTIMIVESNESVPWTKPDGFTLDPKNPKALLGLPGKKGKLLVGLGDGAVRTIDLKKISDETLRNAITIADGNVLGPDW